MAKKVQLKGADGIELLPRTHIDAIVQGGTYRYNQVFPSAELLREDSRGKVLLVGQVTDSESMPVYQYILGENGKIDDIKIYSEESGEMVSIIKDRVATIKLAPGLFIRDGKKNPTIELRRSGPFKVILQTDLDARAEQIRQEYLLADSELLLVVNNNIKEAIDSEDAKIMDELDDTRHYLEGYVDIKLLGKQDILKYGDGVIIDSEDGYAVIKLNIDHNTLVIDSETGALVLNDQSLAKVISDGDTLEAFLADDGTYKVRVSDKFLEDAVSGTDGSIVLTSEGKLKVDPAAFADGHYIKYDSENGLHVDLEALSDNTSLTVRTDPATGEEVIGVRPQGFIDGYSIRLNSEGKLEASVAAVGDGKTLIDDGTGHLMINTEKLISEDGGLKSVFDPNDGLQKLAVDAQSLVDNNTIGIDPDSGKMEVITDPRKGLVQGPGLGLQINLEPGNTTLTFTSEGYLTGNYKAVNAIRIDDNKIGVAVDGDTIQYNDLDELFTNDVLIKWRDPDHPFNLSDVLPDAVYHISDSEENELADKQFVVDQIIANLGELIEDKHFAYREPVPTHEEIAAELKLVRKDGSPVRVNDYAFAEVGVRRIDSEGGAGIFEYEYQRYKYTTGGWEYEYTIGSTPFTQDQINSINSTVTYGDMVKLRTHLTNIDPTVVGDMNPHKTTLRQVVEAAGGEISDDWHAYLLDSESHIFTEAITPDDRSDKLIPTTKAVYDSIQSAGADWQENDPLERSYVRNRTHYIDVDGRVVTLDYAYNPGAHTNDYGQPTNRYIINNPNLQGEVFNDYTNNRAMGKFAHAEGSSTKTGGEGAHAEGQGTEAIGIGAHAEGINARAREDGSHAEGNGTEARAKNSHAEGTGSIATEIDAHAEGYGTLASVQGAHAEGYDTTAAGEWKDNPQGGAFDLGYGSHAEGYLTEAFGTAAHAEGYKTKARVRYSHAEGVETEVLGEVKSPRSLDSRLDATKRGRGSHVEGYATHAPGVYAHAEGNASIALNDYAHAEGSSTANGQFSHAEGIDTMTIGSYSHAEGQGTTVKGEAAHVEGFFTEADGLYAHAEGEFTKAKGEANHAEGSNTTAEGNFTHAEGYKSHASGDYTHAEGQNTKAQGTATHAEGIDTVARGSASHAQNLGTLAYSDNQTVIGKYNIADTANTYPLIVGGGTGDAARRNLFTVNWAGSIWMAGDLTTNGKLYGAVWNDYAEYRKSDVLEPGRVVIENGDGSLSLSSERLQRGAEVVSDTFGYSIGKTDDCQTPVAVSGRVLAYYSGKLEDFKPGYPVCSGPNGTVSVMTNAEEAMYPSRIIGTVSEIPTYETWGSGNVPVNGRIWIRIK